MYKQVCSEWISPQSNVIDCLEMISTVLYYVLGSSNSTERQNLNHSFSNASVK